MGNLVSIITPLYNSEDYIAETINSVEMQTYGNWEMIIVDDCSNDNGKEIVKEIIKKDSRIKLIELNKNCGGAVARNVAIKEAKGKYIAFLDSDDLWHPQKLEKQIKFMEEYNYCFTFTKYQKINKVGKKLKIFINVPKILTYRGALFKNPIGCLTVVYNADELGKLYLPLIRKRQDYGLWLYILKNKSLGYGIDENLAYYRLVNGSISSNKIKLVIYQWDLLRKVEKLSILESIFYILCIVIQKILRIK